MANCSRPVRPSSSNGTADRFSTSAGSKSAKAFTCCSTRSSSVISQRVPTGAAAHRRTAFLLGRSRRGTTTTLVGAVRSATRGSSCADRPTSMRSSPQIYRDATVSVVPSVFPEALGLTSLEAQASGVPVVVSDAGGLPETVSAGQSGLVFENGNAEQLARAGLSICSPIRAAAAGDGRRGARVGDGDVLLGRDRGAKLEDAIARSYAGDRRAATHVRATAPHEGRAARRRHVVLHRARAARGGLSRRVGSPAGVPGRGAARGGLCATRRFPRSTGRPAAPFPLEENPALVASAARRWSRTGRVTIAQHGYTHEDFPDGYEFQAAPDLEARLRDGPGVPRAACSARASACSCRRTTRCRSAASRRSSAAGLNLLGSFLSFRPSMRPWDRRTLGQLVARARVSRRRPAARRPIASIYPHVLRYRRPRRVRLPQPDSGHDARGAGARASRRRGGPAAHFCLATHYWEVDATLKSVLLRFLDHAAARARRASSSPPRGCSTRIDDGRRRSTGPWARNEPRRSTTTRTRARYRERDDAAAGRSRRNQQLIDWLRRGLRSLRPSDRRARSRLRHRPLLLGRCATSRTLVGLDASAAMLARGAPSDSRRSHHAREPITLVQGDLVTHEFAPAQLRSRLLDWRARRARAADDALIARVCALAEARRPVRVHDRASRIAVGAAHRWRAGWPSAVAAAGARRRWPRAARAACGGRACTATSAGLRDRAARAASRSSRSSGSDPTCTCTAAASRRKAGE